MSVGSSLLKGAYEAVSIAKEELEPAAAYVPETVDVAEIRKRLKLSQSAFAERYGLSVATVRDWEQKRRSPERAAIVLLSLINRNPDVVADLVAAR